MLLHKLNKKSKVIFVPSVFLSPSVQEYNPFLTGGSEELYMNLIADAIEPYLTANNITFGRNNPNDTLGQAIEESNTGGYDLHVAIHSNAAPENLAGLLQGPNIYYFPTSTPGNALANILVRNFETIYPDPSLVKAIPSATLRELRRTNAPSVLIETAYHDNPQDEAWIKENINNIAREIARSIVEYFGQEFVEI